MAPTSARMTSSASKTSTSGIELSSLKFGTSGLRGPVMELVGAPAYAYSHAFGEMIREDAAAGPGGEVFIASDPRASSPDIAA